MLLGAVGVILGITQVILYLVQYTIHDPDFYCFERSAKCWPVITVYMISAVLAWVVFIAIVPILAFFIVRLSDYRLEQRLLYLAAILCIDIYTCFTLFTTMISWLIGDMIDSKPRMFNPVSAVTGFILSTLITATLISLAMIIYNLCYSSKLN
jgi:hypothetical protein